MCIKIWWIFLGNTYRFLMLAQVINVITVAIRAIHKPTTTILKYTLCLKGDCVVQEQAGRHWPVSLSGTRGELHLIGRSVFVKRKNKLHSFSINWFNSGRSQLDMILVFTFTEGSQVSWLPCIRRIDRRFHVWWSSPAKKINENKFRCRAETRIYQLLNSLYPPSTWPSLPNSITGEDYWTAFIWKVRH